MADPRRIPEPAGASGTPQAAPQPGAAPRPRIAELDALRGFAVCGIMVVNTWQHTRVAAAPGADTPVDEVIGVLLEARFYPIFSLLFGVSFVLFLDSAAARTDASCRPQITLMTGLGTFGKNIGRSR